MELLESLVVRSVEKFGDRGDGLFNSACFGSTVKDEFRLDACPDGGWTSRVLGGLPYVVPMPHGCHWLYRPRKAGY
jgi:hypothetical protein